MSEAAASTPESHDESEPDPPSAFSTSAMLLKAIPISTLGRDGTLSLADGRLTFESRRPFAKNAEQVFSHPVSQLHSVAASPNGFHVWHQDTCYRFSPAFVQVTGLDSENELLDAANQVDEARRQFASYALVKSAAQSWIAILEPIVGTPPPGVRVRKPEKAWVQIVGAVVVALLFMGVVAACTLLTMEP